MNKNSIIIGIVIVIIMIALYYLIIKNNSENNGLEEFKNSMSTYYQDNTDSDFVMNYHYKNNNVLTTQNNFDLISEENNYGSNWNGFYTYSDGDNSYYACFLQVNKNILFSLSKTNFDIWNNTGNSTDNFYTEEEEEPQCLPDMFIGRGELNQKENLFYLKEVYCSNGNTTNPMEPFEFNGKELTISSINNFYGGYNKDNGISLTYTDTVDNTDLTINLTKDTESKLDFGPSAQYLLRTSYNRPVNIMNNKIDSDVDVCKNSMFGSKGKGTLESCYITNAGLPTPSEEEENSDGYEYNTYGTGCSSEIIDGNCSTEPSKTCFIPINSTNRITLLSAGNYEKCGTSFGINVKNQSSMSLPLYKQVNNQLDMCKIFEPMYGGNDINSCIFMYVDNLMNVQTLGYDFFGPQKDQSYLKTSYDIMFPFMNKNILKTYRETINETALHATNCMETNDVIQNFSQLIKDCKNKYDKIKDNYDNLMTKVNSNSTNVKKSNKDKLLQKLYYNLDSYKENDEVSNELTMPTVWSMNFEQPKDMTNACSFTLSTSKFYQKENQFVKYADFDSFRSKTNMNLYKGSNKQKLVLENPYVLNSNEQMANVSTTINGISNNFILMSGNLRTYNPKKYLVPGQGISTSPFGKEIYLQNNVNPTGKWLVLGLSLNNNLSEGTLPLINNSKTLIKTLNAVKEVIYPSV
jgi:hypothetical protein